MFMYRHLCMRRSLVALSLYSLFVPVQAQQLQEVQVISTTPLPGGALPIEQAPFSVKKPDSLRNDTDRESLSRSLFRGISGVQVTDNQGNPYQSDVTYRGFSVTPLLGTPPGLSVYVDGVRQNETFGDVVRFDAIPQSALKEVTVLPGTMPQFGLNSLGGAIVMQTKSGRDFQGTQLDAELGDFGRTRFGLQKGWIDEPTQRDFYVNFNSFKEDGWRIMSPSSVMQLFGKMGVTSGDTQTNFSLSLYESDLNGNGVVPRSFYEQNRAQSFTYFDNTQNTGGQFAVDFTRFLKSGAELSANAYYRSSKSRTFNGDANENEDYRFGVTPFEPDLPGIEANLGPGTYNVACSAPAALAYAPGTVTFDENDPAAIDPNTADCPGANNRGVLNQDVIGLGLQYAFAPLGAHKLLVGTQLEFGKSDFRRSYALGIFNADRTVGELYAPIEQVNVEASNRQFGIYAQDVWAVGEKTTLLLGGRYNHASVKTTDHLSPVLINVEGEASPGLNNDYTYQRFNPSIGLSYQPAINSTWYASAGTSNRVPTPVELACSDPEFPCLLPNAMAADPFLEQVITTTVEGGYRTRWASGANQYGFSFNLFKADNKNDILFVTDGAGSGGFFQNYGKTRRQGLELDFDWDVSAWNFGASYQYLDATFQSAARLASEGNSSAVDLNGDPAVEGGFIQVQPGNKIPGLAEHNVKLSLGYKASALTTLFVDMQAQSEQYARGNENNQHQAGVVNVPGQGPVEFRDNGKIPGFAVFNLGMNHSLSKNLTVIARLNNVFDRKYFNGAVLGGNIFDRNGALVEEEDDITYETFLAPGTPRNAWLGLSLRF
ncbi:outer membrane receptor protein involved in Fe transport [Limnobacter thiooxidans]|uniref:TonB-dependent receptor n=2 Tax=Limnobacter thiooxidans TaxID=131080 RepID=A0AA86J0J5_9BURK|nr:outer membrane receptor protein involved in Fe transport [Limnobacter thiooxidans]BET25441.1 TonB-dependent receptor [Limnobacter thiooxidans]